MKKELSPKKQKIKDVSDALENILTLKRIWTSKDGKTLQIVLKNNCVQSLKKLVTSAREKPDLNTLLAIIFDYSANLDLLMTLGDLSLEEELRNQLDEAITEAIGEEDK